MKRTLLYYPSVNIPTDEWLKPVILYTDEVSSILPFHITHPEVTNDLRLLHNEGEYRPIYFNEELSLSITWLKEFNECFIQAVTSDEFRFLQTNKQDLISEAQSEDGSYHMYLLKFTQKTKWKL